MSLEQNAKYLEEQWTELMEAVNDREFYRAKEIAQAVSDAGFSLVAGQLFEAIANERKEWEENRGVEAEPYDNLRKDYLGSRA